MATGRSLSELAILVGGKLIGEGATIIGKVASIDEAGPGDITFLSNPRYQRFLAQCRASAVIVGPGIIDEGQRETKLSFIEAAIRTLPLPKIFQLFCPAPQFNGEVSPGAFVDASAIIAEQVTVFARCLCR